MENTAIRAVSPNNLLVKPEPDPAARERRFLAFCESHKIDHKAILAALDEMGGHRCELCPDCATWVRESGGETRRVMRPTHQQPRPHKTQDVDAVGPYGEGFKLVTYGQSRILYFRAEDASLPRRAAKAAARVAGAVAEVLEGEGG